MSHYDLTKTQLAYCLGVGYDAFTHFARVAAEHHGEHFPSPRTGQRNQIVVLYNVAEARAWLLPRDGQRLTRGSRFRIDLAEFDRRVAEIHATAERLHAQALRIARQNTESGEATDRLLTSGEASFCFGKCFPSFVRLRRKNRDFPKPYRDATGISNGLFYDPTALRSWLVDHDLPTDLFDARLQ